MSYHSTPDVKLDAPTIVKMLASDVERLTAEVNRLRAALGDVRLYIGDPRDQSYGELIGSCEEATALIGRVLKPHPAPTTKEEGG